MQIALETENNDEESLGPCGPQGPLPCLIGEEGDAIMGIGGAGIAPLAEDSGGDGNG